LRITTILFALVAAVACADDTSTGPRATSTNSEPRPARLSAQSATQTGIDCGCSSTGAYVDAAEGVPIAIKSDSTSPHGVYKLSAWLNGGSYTLTIKKGASQVAQYTVPSNAKWGFSPDDNRFVYHYLTGGMHNVYAFDLSLPNGPQIKNFAAATTASVIAFSPGGHHLLYAYLTSNTHTVLTIVNGTTGTLEYQDDFTFQIPPITTKDTLGMTSWGFGPESAERTFVYTYLSSSTSASWNVVNLANTPSAALVFSEFAPSGYWQFSPCGDVLGVVRQSTQSQVTVHLKRTSDGLVVNGSDRAYSPVAAVALRSTTTSHIVKYGGVDQTPIATNTASAPCVTAVLSALTLNPTSLRGPATCTGTVTLTSAAPSTGLVVTLSSSNPAAATVPASITVQPNATTATFTVDAKAVTATTNVTITGIAGVTKSAVLTVTAPPPPPTKQLGFNTTGLSFSSQAIGTTSGPKTVIVTSVGTDTTRITSITTSSNFGQTNTCTAPLAPGATCHIDVTFSPSASGTITGSITVTSDGIGSPQTIPLSGTGFVPVVGLSITPTSLGFGSLYLGTATSGRNVKITSTGTIPLVISNVSLGGTNPGDFLIDADGCTGVSVAPGAFCIVTVSFEPLRIGSRIATLDITHNAPGGTASVALSGTGVKPPGGWTP